MAGWVRRIARRDTGLRRFVYRRFGREPRVHPMSDEPATAEVPRRRAVVRGALGVAACLALTAVTIVAPSPAIVVALCACAVATGRFVVGRAPRAFLGRRVHRRPRRLGPIRPSSRRALAEFRRELDALPETVHPTGL